MSVLTNTLKLASSDLFSLSIVAFIIFIMLAAMGNVVLGEEHLGMSSISGALELLLLLWITGDLAGINVVVSGRGLDKLPLMKAAGRLFFVVTWLLLFCVLLNFLVGILAIWYYRSRHSQQAPRHDVLTDMRVMLGPMRRRQRIAFVRMLGQVSQGGSRKTGNRAVDGPGEEELIMRVRGIWLQKKLFHLGAIENMLTCTFSKKGENFLSLDMRMKAAAIAGYVSEHLSHDVDIKGTKRQVRNVRMNYQTRALARAIETVEGITRSFEQSFRTLQTAAIEQKAMSYRLQQIDHHHLQPCGNPRQVSPSRLSHQQEISGDALVKPRKGQGGTAPQNTGWASPMNGTGIDTRECRPGQASVPTHCTEVQDLPGVLSCSTQPSSFRSARPSWLTSEETSGDINLLELGGNDSSFAQSSGHISPLKDSKSTLWANEADNNSNTSWRIPQTAAADGSKTGQGEPMHEPRRRARKLSDVPLPKQATQSRPSTCPDSRQAMLKGLGDDDLQLPGSIPEDLVFPLPAQQILKAEDFLCSSASDRSMRSIDNDGWQRSNHEDSASEEDFISDDECTMFSPIAPNENT